MASGQPAPVPVIETTGTPPASASARARAAYPVCPVWVITSSTSPCFGPVLHRAQVEPGDPVQRVGLGPDHAVQRGLRHRFPLVPGQQRTEGAVRPAEWAG